MTYVQLKQRAQQLRKKGIAINKIASQLGLGKSTISYWCRGIVLTAKQIKRLRDNKRRVGIKKLLEHIEKRKSKRLVDIEVARSLGRKDVGTLSLRDLYFLGLALYWGEGYKRPIIKNGKPRTYHPVSLSNSDPKLIAVFLKFLREVCKVDETRIRAGLRIYQHQNAGQLLQFWSKLTRIPERQFDKYYYGISKSSLGKRPFNILPYGTIQIRINDTNLYHKIMGWIEGLNKLI